MTDSVVARSSDGTFIPGVSGNPAGKPAGTKNRLTALKQDLEIAVRENVSAKDIREIVGKMVDLAKEGNSKAAKLILDKFVSNASEGEEAKSEELPRYVFVIQNATGAMTKNAERNTDLIPESVAVPVSECLRAVEAQFPVPQIPLLPTAPIQSEQLSTTLEII